MTCMHFGGFKQPHNVVPNWLRDTYYPDTILKSNDGSDSLEMPY